jgi:HlyD family secretion protein
MKRWIKWMIAVLVAIALVGTVAAWRFKKQNGQPTPLRTAPVSRGDVVASIGATGTVEPEEVVDVGSQVAGRIASFGKDKQGKTIDYGSQVEEGTVLAMIDDVLYAATVAESQAQVQQARAAVAVAQANLGQGKAKLDQAQRDWDRAQKLGPSEALAQSSYDAYRSAYETAQAGVAIDQAAIVQAQASQTQAEATLKENQQRLSYCTITSPVEGVIIDRRVNIGQTVVASLNAPSLFLLAKDLKRMQVWVAVNEADIGKIHPGQPVTFTVDAFPGEVFHGQVGKVRLNASMTQNVVTYTVEVITDNSSGRLLPYLSANVKFELNRHDNVLRVPSAALRWTPAPDLVAPEYRNAEGGSAAAAAPAQGGRPASSRPAAASGNGATQGTLWVPEGGFVRPVHVQVGLSSSTDTEVQGKDLTEGLEVVTGIQTQVAAQTDTTNPFAPRMRRGGTSAPGGPGGASGPNGPGAATGGGSRAGRGPG